MHASAEAEMMSEALDESGDEWSARPTIAVVVVASESAMRSHPIRVEAIFSTLDVGRLSVWY